MVEVGQHMYRWGPTAQRINEVGYLWIWRSGTKWLFFGTFTRFQNFHPIHFFQFLPCTLFCHRISSFCALVAGGITSRWFSLFVTSYIPFHFLKFHTLTSSISISFIERTCISLAMPHQCVGHQRATRNMIQQDDEMFPRFLHCSFTPSHVRLL